MLIRKSRQRKINHAKKAGGKENLYIRKSDKTTLLTQKCPQCTLVNILCALWALLFCEEMNSLHPGDYYYSNTLMSTPGASL